MSYYMPFTVLGSEYRQSPSVIELSLVGGTREPWRVKEEEEHDDRCVSAISLAAVQRVDQRRQEWQPRDQGGDWGRDSGERR